MGVQKFTEENILDVEINNIDLTIQTSPEPTYYYYKRWIWMIFPWACLQSDKRYSFSDIIQECYNGSLNYISVDDEEILSKCNNSIK